MKRNPMHLAPAAKHSATGILTLCVASALAASHPAWAQTINTGTTSAPASTSTTSAGTTATATGITAGTTTTAGSTTGSTSGSTAAATTTTVSTATTGTTNSFQSGSFATFAGSGSNARALFSSLRTGTPATLTAGTTTGTTAGTGSVTFTPTTGAMGTGNVRIALALAQDSLTRQGITSPTPQQLSAALNGGSITAGNPPRVVQMPGVLTLRSQGMGWGRVAQTLGVKLGPVMAASRSGRTGLASLHRDDHHDRHEAEHRVARADDRDGARHQLAQGTSGSGTRTSTAVPTVHHAIEQRIVTAAGTAGTTTRGELRNGHAASGVVTAAGGAGTSSSVRSDGTSSHGTRVAIATPSRGIVTAAGTPAVVVTSATSGAMPVRANAMSGSGGSTFRSESHSGGGIGGAGGIGGGRGR